MFRRLLWVLLRYVHQLLSRDTQFDFGRNKNFNLTVFPRKAIADYRGSFCQESYKEEECPDICADIVTSGLDRTLRLQVW